MNDDPIVAELQDIRARLLEECGGDIEKLLDRYKSLEKSDAERVVDLEEVLRRKSLTKSVDR